MRNSIFTKAAISAAGILAVLALWQALAAKYPPLILPSPVETLEALVELWQSGRLWANSLITFQRTLAGFGLAFLAGIAVALTLHAFSFCRWMLQPLITIVQIIPPVVWIILAVIWFGVAKDTTVIFLVFVVTFPVVFINVFSGFGGIDAKLVEMAEVYRCSPAQVIIHIYLPSLLPHLVSAASVGLAFAWKSAVFAEFIGSSSGVGFALSMAYSNLETEKVFAWTVILIVVMFAFEYGVLGAAKRRATRWVHHE